MDLPLVSIIIPIYNAENTIERCVDSVLYQNYKNTEIILVNDGSTDKSLSICREYVKRDKRVNFIDKQNTGVSDCRNIGISNASGKYLQFVDSDDWITENSTAALTKKAEAAQCDMVIANFYRVVNGRKAEKGHIKVNNVMDKKSFISFMMKEPANFYYGVMWNKLYHRDIVTAYKVSCRTELNWCEDFLFNLDYIRYAESFAALDIPVYYYVKTKNSLVDRECNLNNIAKMKLRLFGAYKDLFESMDFYEENRAQVTRFLIAYAKDNSIPYSFPRKNKEIQKNSRKGSNRKNILHISGGKQYHEMRDIK